MGHGPCRFKEKDIHRAVRASRKMGIEPAALRCCPDGTIEVVADRPDERAPARGHDDTDLELAEFEARQRLKAREVKGRHVGGQARSEGAA
jgi:hypothetical protein